jgi:hypothetical protein
VKQRRTNISARVTRKEIAQFLEKVAKTLSKPKIFTSKLKLKVQSIYIKSHLKPKNTFNKPYFEIAYLGESLKNLLEQKSSPKMLPFLGYFIYSKHHNWPPKVAQLA